MKKILIYQKIKKKYQKIKINIKIYNKDILKFNLEKINKKNSIIFGNLPYNISSQIFVKILNLKIGLQNLKFNIYVSKRIR